MKYKIPTRIQKIYRWEFWPVNIFYIPIFLYVLFLIFRSRSLTFFTAVNPCMYNGGFIGDSKYKILSVFKKNLLPKTLLIPNGKKIPGILESIADQKHTYPLILKPDIGMRGKGRYGKGVEKIDSEMALKEYFQGVREDILIQEYIDLACEFGVFYVRFPDQEKGRITSLMQREYLTIEGNGADSLRECILDHDRAVFYRKNLFIRYKNELETILKKGERRKLVSIGNHCRGTKFINICDKITPQLEKTFDELSQEIPGFFYGRYDVKANSLVDLEKRSFKIIELNGANAEPGHVYDPQMSLFRAYKDYCGHWNMMRKIAEINMRNGILPTSFAQVIRDIRK